MNNLHIEVQRIMDLHSSRIEPETIHVDDIRGVRKWTGEDEDVVTCIHVLKINGEGDKSTKQILIKENYHTFVKRLSVIKPSIINKLKPKNNE
jgi:alpha/beta superfamily hydrolase